MPHLTHTCSAQGLSCHFMVGEAQLVEVHLSSVRSWGIHHYIFTGWGWSCSKVLPSSHWSSAHVHSWGYRTCFHLHKALGKVLSNIDWPVHERPVPSHIDHFVFFCVFFFPFPRDSATQSSAAALAYQTCRRMQERPIDRRNEKRKSRARQG